MNDLFITDKRMLLLMEWAIKDGVAIHESDYLQKINFPRTNISNVRKGRLSFNKEHIHNACKLTGASADYIYGFTHTILRKENKNPLEMIKQAVMALEEKKTTNKFANSKN